MASHIKINQRRDPHDLDPAGLNALAHIGYAPLLADLQKTMSYLVGKRVSLEEIAIAHIDPESPIWKTLLDSGHAKHVLALRRRIEAYANHQRNY